MLWIINAPYSGALDWSILSKWNCSGKIRGCGLTVGGVTGNRLGVLKRLSASQVCSVSCLRFEMWTPFYCSCWLLPATSAPPSGLLSLWNRKPHKPVLPDIILVMAFYHSNWKVAKTDVVSSSISVFMRREGPVIGYPSSVCYRKWRCLCGQNSDHQSNY